MTSCDEMTDDALFNLGIDLNREETVGGAIDRTLTAVRTTLGDTAITVWRSRNEHGSNLENGQSPEQPSPTVVRFRTPYGSVGSNPFTRRVSNQAMFHG
jgi:hypothetical protein